MKKPKYRIRTKELIVVKASELLAHPDNFREHGAIQREAMAGILGEIGRSIIPTSRRKYSIAARVPESYGIRCGENSRSPAIGASTSSRGPVVCGSPASAY